MQTETKSHLKNVPLKITKSWIYTAYGYSYSAPELRNMIDAIYKDVNNLPANAPINRKNIIPLKVFKKFIELEGLPRGYKL